MKKTCALAALALGGALFAEGLRPPVEVEVGGALAIAPAYEGGPGQEMEVEARGRCEHRLVPSPLDGAAMVRLRALGRGDGWVDVDAHEAA